MPICCGDSAACGDDPDTVVVPRMARVTKRLTKGLLCAAAVVLCSFDAAVAQPAPGKALIVLDSSESMQHKLAADSKIMAASNAVSRLLKRYGERIPIGVIAFGHRRSLSCSDIKEVKPLDAGVGPTSLEAIAALRPRGPSPIADALIIAAQTAELDPQLDHIILIAGSTDSCEADPCATAKLLKEQGRPPIDVIAIDAEDGVDFRQLRCVAQVTGGSYRQVGAAVDITVALNEILASLPGATGPAVAATSAPAAGADWATTEPGAAAAPEAAIEDTTTTLLKSSPDAGAPLDGTESMVSLAAVVAEGGPAIASGLVWRVYPDQPAADGQFTPIRTTTEPQPSLPLPPGAYRINVTYGRAYLTRRIIVSAEQNMREVFILNAGGLRIAAVLPGGTKLPAAAVRCDVLSDDRDQLRDRTLVAGGIRPGVVLRLNAGLYSGVCTYGDTNAVTQGDIVVEAGKLTVATFTQTGATVTFKLVLQPGGEALADTSWRIIAADGTMVKESAGALPTHILAAGRYTIEATRGGETYSQPVMLQPGVAQQVELVVPKSG
jgi:hypothetical protein